MTTGLLLDRRRTLVTSGVAAAVHAALLLLAVRVVSPSSTAARELVSSVEEAREIELSILPSASESVEALVAHSRAEEAPAAAMTSTATSGQPAATRDGAIDAPRGEPGPPAASATPLTLFVPDPGALGIAGGGTRNPFLPRGSGADSSAGTQESSTAEAKRVDRSLASALHERDGAMGLGPDGPVLDALRSAAYAGLAPESGGATFLAVIDAGGLVVDLKLVSSYGGESGWRDARDRAARALAGKKLALRGAGGAELRIAVESDVVLPSGAKPARPVSPALSASKIISADNIPSGNGATSDIVKAYTVGQFDLADIKAKPRRIVHARLVSMVSL